MNGAHSKTMEQRAAAGLRLWQEWPTTVCTGLLVTVWCLVELQALGTTHAFPDGSWLETGLIVLGILATLFNGSRQLPAQAVIFGSALVLISTLLALAIALKFDLNPAPPWSVGQAGHAWTDAWWSAAAYLLVLFNARGVARLVLRQQRQHPAYGFRVIGLTTVLVIGLALGWGSAALQAGRIAFWASTTLVCLCLATPAWINKRPVEQPVDAHPALLWALLNLLLGTIAASTRSWLGLGASLAQLLIVAAAGLRFTHGARPVPPAAA